MSEFTSQRFIDTRTGEIVVQVPISEIAHFEEYNGPELQPFTVWAVQLLHASHDIEAENAEQAERIAGHLYMDGGLDPSDVIDGDYGIGEEQWTVAVSSYHGNKKLVEFAEFALNLMQATQDWDADMTDDISGEAYRLGLAHGNEFSEFERVTP